MPRRIINQLKPGMRVLVPVSDVPAQVILCNPTEIYDGSQRIWYLEVRFDGSGQHMAWKLPEGYGVQLLQN